VSGSRNVEKILERTSALLTGHFLLSSGKHSEGYVQCARALEHPNDGAALGAELATRLAELGVERVVSPPLGALLIGYEVARGLGVPFSFPERADDGGFCFRRGFEIRPGERIAVVEDVITTGRTTAELLEAMSNLKAEVVALGAIVDRSSAHEVRGTPIVSLLRLQFPTYDAADCPLCESGDKPTKPGSRKDPEVKT